MLKKFSGHPTFAFLAVIASLALAGSATAQLDADAGDDFEIECTSADGAEANLDGTDSSQGEGIEYLWTNDRDVELDDPTILTPVGVFPLGTTVATLTVSGEGEDDESDEVEVDVVDTTPPVVKVFADPFVLWPPNHEMHEVRFRIRIRDACSGSQDDHEVTLLSVESSESDNGKGDGNTKDDIQNAEIGTDDRVISLRAERSGPGKGRVYTATYRVSDGSGNETDAVARVTVPHDQGQLRKLLKKSRDDHREDLEPICPTPSEAAEHYAGARPPSDSFTTKKLCVQACKAWAKGCRHLSKAAAQCTRAEHRAFALLDRIECRDDESKDEAKTCSKDVQEERKEFQRKMRDERSSAQDECKSEGRSCAEECQDLL